MKRQLYGVQNLSCNDESQTNNYILTGNDSQVGQYKIPLNLSIDGYITPSELIDFIGTEPLADRLSAKYTKGEINLMLERVRSMVKEMIRNMKKEYMKRR